MSEPKIANGETRTKLWRSLGERVNAPELDDARSREFARGADEAPDPIARRDFFRLVGASAALAGAAGCERAPRGVIEPYVTEPAEGVPGTPAFFTTALTTDGYAVGVVVESHEGRPTKIEGNPDHPASLGATSAQMQAALLDVYDPDRARAIMKHGAPATWGELAKTLATRVAEKGAHLVLPPTSSPLVADQIARLRATHAGKIDVRWHAPLAPLAAWKGAQIALGETLEARVNLRAAKVIVALDADCLFEGPAALVLARDFADGRRLKPAAAGMNRLYAIEPSPSVTGMSADHRLRVRARDVLAVAARVTMELAQAGVSIPRDLVRAIAPWGSRAEKHDAFAKALARDLAASQGACVVLAGAGQPAEVHALACAVNELLGNVGKTIAYAPSPIADAGSEAFELAPLARALDAGEVETLVVLGGNPVYGAFADLELARRLRAAKESVYLGAYVDETAAACEWFLPEAHALTAWGDARAFEGTVSITQPLLGAPADARTVSQVLSAMLGEAPATSHDLLAAYWKHARPDFDAEWNRWLSRGVVPGTAIAPVAAPVVRMAEVARAVAALPVPAAADDDALEIGFRPDARVRDGARTNNAWLMETPDPATRLTWGNAALLSRATAAHLGVEDGDVVALTLGGRAVSAPVLVAPGQADNAIALSLGYGRSGASEEIARGVGANAFALRTAHSAWFASGLTAVKTGAREELALEQLHSSLEGRDDQILLHRTFAELLNDPAFAAAHDKRPLALYEPKRGGARQWGMVIDLNACTGCAACVVACQAENNIPVVGKAGVAKGRAMHWIRIDRYFFGPPDDPGVLLEPMLCQHCEKAPCEYVCPVNATTHSSDGLNQMVYNRCVGTRFCSNNCPYKVRRFNWFNYQQGDLSTPAPAHNPDVTVRARGVMEKCTYCVQRIREAEIKAEVARAPLRDGAFATACEQACPSRAIAFGDIADERSRVSVLRASERRFAVLNDLGTVPRTRYLARITNPNPELA